MQLDVNAAWPKLMIHETLPGKPPTRWIDRRSTGPSDMYIKGAPKDSFALFARDMPAELAATLR